MMGRAPHKDRKVIAVFVTTAQEAAAAIAHLMRGGVDLPIFLYCRELPADDTAGHCVRVSVNRSAFKLLCSARAQLATCWVALGIVAWNRKRADWLLKVAPFLFPPFRVLVMNEHSDFFPGHPGSIARHLSHRTSGACRTYVSWLTGAIHRISCELRTAASWLAGVVRLMYLSLLECAAKIYVPGPFEFAAQFSSPISRLVFSFFRGTETIVISAPRRRDNTTLLIDVPNGEWRREEILRGLFESNSQWVVFQDTEGQETGSWDDMLPLFEEQRTFAVARQIAFQGWLKTVLPAAPFRTLQPDEASQVLAPLSTQIIFDREKLVALGMPNLKSAAANFCLLFWKAAAAGWRSYSVGSRQPVTQLPAMPLAEAQFVQALLRDSSLARLQTREPALASGCIAQPANGGRPFRGLPRVLIVSPYLPFPLSHGGAVRIFNLCRALSRDFDLILACFREKDDFTDYERLHQIFREVYVVSIGEAHHHSALPADVTGYESSAMRALIPRICAERRIDLLQFEYTQLAAYRETVLHLPAILVEHDITFSLYRQLAQRDKTDAAERAYQFWLKFETDRLRAFDMVWTMSEADRQLAIDAGASPDQVTVVPNGVDLQKFSVGAEQDPSVEILYVGSFRHRPNYLAFRELCDSIMPLVWRDLPEATLSVVAGPNHEDHWPGPRKIDSRITVHGFVADLVPLYRACALTVVPLPVSAGTNIKVMESLACERALVSTPVGCAGLNLRDGVDALICDLGPSFVAAICHLLRNPSMRRSMARQGRFTAEERFGWESIKDRAAESYEQLLGLEPRLLPGNGFSAHQAQSQNRR